MNRQSEGITIGDLGRECGLSRSTLLYYDRLGLLRPGNRSGGNYRLYSPTDTDRLKQICFYRRMGIPLKEIARLLGQAQEGGPAQRILQRRLETLEAEIEQRQHQQREIVRLLEQLSMRQSTTRRGKDTRSRRALKTGNGNLELDYKEKEMVSKQRWVEIMIAAGFNDQDMKKWHKTFEKMEPQGHQEFLESLGIGADEIARIREWSAQ